MESRARWVGVAVLGALVLFGPGAVQQVQLLIRQRQLDRELSRLAAERARLSREETRLRSDPTYVEGLIRSTFKYARPGEYVIPLELVSSESTR